jgi:cytoskeleton protein RodZ
VCTYEESRYAFCVAGGERHVPFGRELQLEREKLGISLTTVAEETKVGLRNLQALEADDFRSLPGGVFQRGIVRSYCRFLALNEQEWLERFAVASQNIGGELDWAEFAENVKRARVPSRSGTRLRWWGVLAMFVALVALGWAVWLYVVKPRMHDAVAQPFRQDSQLEA